ncbi:MAG: hypothetical protein L0220_30620 [Acidobacteria bacterium]|nr:hypothetical protein [Acidobacteriota bacterium]
MSKRIFLVFWLLLAGFYCSISVAQQPARPKGVNPSPLPSAKTAEVIAATNEILDEVSQMRGLEILKPVKSGVKSRSEIEQEVIRNFEESFKPEEIETINKNLIAYGLVAKDFRYRDFMVKLMTEQVAGFYRPKSKELFLADWNELGQQRTIMAHELVHALQDQHFDLRRFENWPRGDGDREAAIHALIEGDATGVMYNYMLKPVNSDFTKLPSISSFSDMTMAQGEKDGQKVLLSAPAAIRESLIFPYVYGADFVKELVKIRGWNGVSQAFTDLPQSTEQIIHFEKYSAREEPVKIKLSDISSLLGMGWKRIDADVNGEFGYFLILSQFIDKQKAREAAAGWGGDQSTLYENSVKGQLLLAHLSTWDTAAEAGDFFKAYADRTLKRYPGAKVRKLSANERSFETPEGETFMQLREKSVLIIEGLPAEKSKELENIFNALWKQ